MKAMMLILTLFSFINCSNSQTNEECINITETNLNDVVTNVIKITKYDEKIVVLSERDNKKYRLSINTNSSTKFIEHIKVGARISIQAEDGISYIIVARKEELGILVRRFEICN